MSANDFEAGRTIPLLIPEPIWREWKINGVGADSLKELQAEHGKCGGLRIRLGPDHRGSGRWRPRRQAQ